MRQPPSAVREALLGGLQAGHSVTDAAKLAKVSRSTAHRIINEPSFRADMEGCLSAQRVPFDSALADAMRLAVETLQSLLASKSDAVRLRAATALLTPRQFASQPSAHPSTSEIPEEKRRRLSEALEKRIQQRMRAQGWTPPGEMPGPVRTFVTAQLATP